MEHRKHTMSKYMMATTAIHKMGDISSDFPDICHVYDEDELNYYGMWVFGFGFFDVRFPKETTRNLTDEEIKKYDKTYVQISDQPPVQLRVT